MKRWLALCLLLASSSGCMLFDDMAYHDDYPAVHVAAEPPMGTCGQQVRQVSAVQTAEPELLRR